MESRGHNQRRNRRSAEQLGPTVLKETDTALDVVEGSLDSDLLFQYRIELTLQTTEEEEEVWVALHVVTWR